MQLEELKILHFKNYEKDSLAFGERLNGLVGWNGMGKTNLLDAIYYLCMCKSHFRLNDRSIVRHGSEFFRLEGHFIRKGKRERIVAKIIPGKKKIIERNDVAYDKIADHIGLLPVVLIAPDDTQLASEGSESRRRFMDNTLSQIDANYLTDLIRYNKILRQRNEALKQMAASHRFDQKLIQSYDQQLVPRGLAIFERRQNFLHEFEPLFEAYYQKISGGAEKVNFRYRTHLEQKEFHLILAESLEKDRTLQRTTTGIHRDDILFSVNGYPLKNFGSQGQLKSFILALKLAQYEVLRQEKDMNPILLLDDIFDKLDLRRIRLLLELLLDNEFGQIFLSDTQKDRVQQIVGELNFPLTLFEIKAGQTERIR